MDTQYIYTKVIDADGSNQLSVVIIALGLSGTLTQLSTLAPNQLYLYFSIALSAGEKTQLDNAVANFVVVPVVPEVATTALNVYSKINTGITVTVPLNQILLMAGNLYIKGDLVLHGDLISIKSG